MEAYAKMTPQARTEFDLWLRNETGLEVGSVHCFEVLIGKTRIRTSHYYNTGKGVASRDGEALWFQQTFDRELGVWLKDDPIVLFPEET